MQSEIFWAIEEWAQGSASALWDLKTGQVLYSDGIHDEASIRRGGKPLRKWLQIPDRPPTV
jgi:hypothetical protein